MTALDLSMASVKPSKRVKGPYRVVKLSNPHNVMRPCASTEDVEDSLNSHPHDWTLINANVQVSMEMSVVEVSGQKMQVPGAMVFGGTAVFRVPEEQSE